MSAKSNGQMECNERDKLTNPIDCNENGQTIDCAYASAATRATSNFGITNELENELKVKICKYLFASE